MSCGRTSCLPAALAAGAMARWLGAPAAVVVGAAAQLLIVGWVAWNVPEVRRAR